MTDGGGWPATDEDLFMSRAGDLTQTLRELTSGLEHWSHEGADLSAGTLWSGSGANAGNTAIQKSAAAMTEQQTSLVTVVTWMIRVSALIRGTKLAIASRVSTAEAAIAALKATNLRGEVRQDRIEELVAEARDANIADVSSAAAFASFSNWMPSGNQLSRMLDNLLKPEATAPSVAEGEATSGAITDTPPPAKGPERNGDIETVRSRDDQPVAADPRAAENPAAPLNEPLQPSPHTDSPPAADTGAADSRTAVVNESQQPSSPAPPLAANPRATESPSGGLVNTPAPPTKLPSGGAPSPPPPGPSLGHPATPISTGGSNVGSGGGLGSPSIGGSQGLSGGTGGGGPQAPAATAGPGQGSGQAPVSTPQQNFQKGFTDATKAANANPMPLNQTPLGPAAPAAQPVAPVYQQPDTTSPTAPAAAATNHSTPVTSAPTPSAPPAPAAPTGAPPMPLGNPSTPAPVSPGAGPVGPAVAPASTNQGAAGGAAAPVPISAARAERDAIATAATAGAVRRRGPNPRQLSRHIAAALNVDITDPSLFWITAVTSDGQILTANNYGLAYIPEHVHLPEQVRMVTADESIPAQTRGTWATYPLLAVQEWARHHDATLQAVAGTEENLKGFDLGAARDILTAEDMPDNGKMQGRNRLEVIAPEVATKLAGISASGLTELLPPAPADNTPPADNRINLLLEVCKPLLSANPDRAGAHLKAMVAYADHLQDVALFRAHTAQDAELQRSAIAEWIYWQHISVLSTDALAAVVS